MRGYGDSEKPAGIHSYYLLNMVEDLRQLVAGLGKHKFHLVAHDWGGFVCWTFATMVIILIIHMIKCFKNLKYNINI